MTERVINFKGYVPREASETELKQPPPGWASQEAHDRACSLPFGGAHKHLTRGFSTGDGGEFKTLESYREAWLQHRDNLIAEWVNHSPLSRPAAFWICDFTGELSGKVVPRLDLHFGRPIPVKEDQAEILRANGLLTDDELAALESQAA